MRGVFRIGFVAVTAIALHGCAAGAGGGGSGDPGARPLPSGESCGSIRSQLNRLDSRGVPAQVQRASSGASLSPGQRTDVDNYNRLLGLYLGSRCHV